MPLLFGHDADVAAWVEQKMDGQIVFPHRAVGMLSSDGALKGAFLFTFHNACTAELTLYSEGVVTNGMWRDAMRFVFGLGVHRLQIRTAKTNKAVKKAAQKFGFKFESIVREFWGPGCDAVLYFMTPSTCRWIK